MNGISVQVLMFLLSCLSLAGLGFSGILVSRAQADRKRLQDRFALIAAPHTRHRRIEISAFTRPVVVKKRSLATSFAGLFRINPDKLHVYPAPWWLVLLITLAAANVCRLLCEPLMGPAALPAMAALWVMMCRSFFGWAEQRVQDKMLNQFPDALAMIVRSVRVGIPVMEAIRAVARESPGPTGPEFGQLVDDVAVGTTLEDAVQELAQRSNLPEYRFFATALSLQNQTGGTLSETLDNLADVIRKRIALKAKGYAMTSEARTSALVLGAMPIVTGAAMWLANPSYIGLLFVDATGNKLLGGAILSLGLGMFVIRTIIRKTLA